MEQTILKQLLTEQKKIFEKEIHIVQRHIPSTIIKTPKIIVISGVRRCGKSTLLRQLSKHYPDYHYINFEDERLIDFTYQDFNSLLESFFQINPKATTFFFDEIQEVKGWEKFVRRLFTEGYKVFVTGSNATLLSSEIATSITGRNMKAILYPFSYTEYLSYHDVKLQEIPTTKEKATLSAFFHEYLHYGGFPEIIQSKDFEELSQIYQDIIIKDLLVRKKIRDTKEFRELSLYLLSNIGKKISYNNLKELLEVSTTSKVKNYVDFLQEAYIFFTINKYDPSLKKQLVNKKKIYAIDTGMVNAVSFQFSKNQGRLLENVVFLDLLRKYPDIYYFEDKKECDFVLKRGGKITQVIQVAATISDPNTYQRELEGLQEAMDAFTLQEGLLLTLDHAEEISVGKNHIIIKPVWQWLLETNNHKSGNKKE